VVVGLRQDDILISSGNLLCLQSHIYEFHKFADGSFL
jgi:hypothetical protein